MKIKPCEQTVTLPAKHFAILFEGAWLFTPDKGTPGNVLATCPDIDSNAIVHECTFGTWSGRAIDPLDGFDSSTMPMNRFFHVNVEDFEPPTDNFHTLFSNAAANFPFLYVPYNQSRSSGGATPFTITDKLNHKRTRRVSMPLPNQIVADAVLVSSEIDGVGIGHAVGAPVAVKRPVITVIFVYKYCGVAAAATVRGHKSKATIIANKKKPKPHLIFNIHPPASMGLIGGHMEMDDAAQKNHTTATFEALRKTVSMTGSRRGPNAQSSLCDIAIYHERSEMEFRYGNSGLDQFELGLAIKEFPLGPDLASCGSGVMAVDTGS